MLVSFTRTYTLHACFSYQDFRFSRGKLQYVDALRRSVTLPVRGETLTPLELGGDWSDGDFQAVMYLHLVLEQQGYLEGT